MHNIITETNKHVAPSNLIHVCFVEDLNDDGGAYMIKRWLIALHMISIMAILAACDTGSISGTGPSGSPGATCTSTDQDQYVYHPDRLHVVQACAYVTGVVDAVRTEADGDLHILLHLDAPYQNLLQPANQNEQGDLVVEPVCVGTVTQQDAIDTCAADHDPYSAPLPSVGDHVWMEGRYVYDEDHGGWAELHPLYRSGAVTS